MRSGSSPTRYSASTSTAARTTSARPSTTGSPHPTMPSSVCTRQKSQRGGTRNVSILSIFTKRPFQPGHVLDGLVEQPAHGPGGPGRVASADRLDHGLVAGHRVGGPGRAVHHAVAFGQAGLD